MNFLRMHTRKLIFAALMVVVYYIVANPWTYNLVGSILGYPDYDNPNKQDRDKLLIVHSFVMGIVCFGMLFLYLPSNVAM